jgi:membrane-bound lytic murein transglycosylase D
MYEEIRMSKMARWVLLAQAILLSACATTHTIQQKPIEGTALTTSETVPPAIKENEVPSEVVEQNIEKPYKSAYGEIALDYNEHVEMWIRYFQGKGRKYMEQYLERSSRYLPMMKNTLRENGLPEDLVYISLIESGFSPQAHSRSNAVGYWQFIRSTGRRFGLNVDPFIDERRDPVLSTRAAAEYFKELYSLFGSWHLALSAYNTGENRVRRAVTKNYTRDFWELIKKRRALPRETKQYVPKFIAATLIAKDPAKYGFTGLQFEDPLSYDTVNLQNAISLTKLATNLNVDVEEMKLLNPKFRSDFVPISRGTETTVRIPVGRGTDAAAALSMSGSTQPKVPMQAEYYFYRVRSGDNLSTIAHRQRTTVSTIRRLNNLSNRVLLRVGMHLRVPDHGGEGIHLVSEEDAVTGASQPAVVNAVETRTLNYHVVRRGENLAIIAHRYGVTVDDLKKLNNLSSRGTIRRGQRLKIREESPKSATKRKAGGVLATFKSHSLDKKIAQRGHGARSLAGQSRVQSRRHIVRRGETMYDVSKKYHVALYRLAKANGHKVNYRVMAGERLVIPQ